ncbi:MAG: helix-turn-helix domain-containing protein [Candidatus Woesearchaeota archaeon]
MDDIYTTLEELGLRKQEIGVYLALIKHDSLSALQISKETGIDRTTAYDILRKIMDKGIVSTVNKGKTKHFMALTPDDLLFHYKRKYSSLETMMPQLKNIAGTSTEPIKCELFQGKEGLVNVIKDLVTSRQNYKAIGIREEYEEIIGYFHKQFLIKIDMTKVKETAIVERNAVFKKAKNGKYKYVDTKLQPITTVMYGDVVVFFIWEGPHTAIRVKNKTFAKSQEEQFDLLWKTAKK